MIMSLFKFFLFLAIGLIVLLIVSLPISIHLSEQNWKKEYEVWSRVINNPPMTYEDWKVLRSARLLPHQEKSTK